MIKKHANSVARWGTVVMIVLTSVILGGINARAQEEVPYSSKKKDCDQIESQIREALKKIESQLARFNQLSGRAQELEFDRDDLERQIKAQEELPRDLQKRLFELKAELDGVNRRLKPVNDELKKQTDPLSVYEYEKLIDALLKTLANCKCPQETTQPTETAMKPSQTPPSKPERRSGQVFVGYQFERAPDEPAKNLNGVDGQVFYDFAQHIGIGADFAWTTGSDRIGTTTDVTLHRFTGLFGPRFNVTHSLHNGSGKELTFHFPILIGFDHDSTRFQSSTLSTSSASTAFMMSLGANLDVMLTKNFGIRPVDLAYQPTHFGGFWQNNIRIAAGIVFRFGKEKELPTW